MASTPSLPLQLLVFNFPLVIGLILRPSTHSTVLKRILFLTILLYSSYVCFFTTSDIARLSFATGCNIGTTIFLANDYLLLTKEIQREVWETETGDESKRRRQEMKIENMSLSARIRWAIRLIYAPRGINWSFEPTSRLPKRPRSLSRKSFVVRQLLWLGFYTTLHLELSKFNQWNPRFAPLKSRIGHDTDAQETKQLFEILAPYTNKIWWRFTACFIISQTYCILSMFHIAQSIVAVASGLSEAADWPALFMSPLEAYTLRKYWGSFWHQLHRRFLTTNAIFFISLLPYPWTQLPQKSKLRSYTMLFTTFFLSGFSHYIGDFMELQGLPLQGGALRYFVLQAVAITIEDAVIGLARMVGLNNMLSSGKWKLVGYAWVVVWFSWSHSDWMDSKRFA